MRIDRLAARELGEFWSLREDVTVDFGRRTVLRTPWGELCVEHPDPLLREALNRMLLGPVSLGNVAPGFPGYDVPEDEWNDASRALLGVLEDLQHVTVRHLSIGASPLLSVVPLSPGARFHPPSTPPGAEFRLPREMIRRGPGDDPVLAHEGADHRVELHGPDAPRLLVHLRGGYEDSPLPPDAPLPQPVVRAARSYAAAAGMLAAADLKSGSRR
ncbi:hypothetical protein [Streptomyces sp. NPDC058382]|uniref:hypothetical protein n=1 Tax=unclassified Streptomyces TaxID=2593676 RepID=UPI00362794DD